jgi:hypothetical protein
MGEKYCIMPTFAKKGWKAWEQNMWLV